jgi:glucose-1-phosphate cytidylyltransferase
MKVIILAGGFGTRISEYTKKIPKPMIKIGRLPILMHIMKIYINYGHTEFILALGYKSKVIKDYFKVSSQCSKIEKVIDNKRVLIHFADTGSNTMTGGRLKRLKSFFKNGEDFLMTYGDGVADLDINKVIKFHKRRKRILSLTAVRPPARFGSITLVGNRVKTFKEKNQLQEGWINGGFFVMNSEIFKYIKGDSSILEREPFEKIAKDKLLFAYKHTGFWQCMDTLRDKEYLDSVLLSRPLLWKK